ncbi:MAG: alpha/beta hydrolase-fold protein [Acidobacteriota bacterium]
MTDAVRGGLGCAGRTRWRAGAAIVATALATGGCTGEPQTFGELQRALQGRDSETQAALIEQLVKARGGTPLVEGRARLVFLARAVDGKAPRIVGDFNAWASTPSGHDPAAGVMTRLGDTDWHYLEASAFSNARLEYVLLFDIDARPDPLNPRTVEAYAGPRSEVRMPFWEPQWELEDADVPAGEVVGEAFVSRALGGTRRVWYYLPPGYDEGSGVLPSVFVLDGGNYVERMAVPRILDRLIARQAVPPLVAVFLEPVDRQEEYSRNPRWRQFVTGELVPSVDARFRTFPGPERRVILGSSLAAYGAIDLAIEHPGVFGLVAALAPPAQTATVISNQEHGRRHARSITFFVLGGTYDTSIDGARRLRTALDDVNASVVYREVPEGHSTETFRGRLDEALGALLGR